MNQFGTIKLRTRKKKRTKKKIISNTDKLKKKFDFSFFSPGSTPALI